MTDSAKLAWAEREGVTPPDYVVAAARREAAEVRGAAECPAPGSSLAASGCCSEEPSACCNAKQGCGPDADEVAPAPARDGGVAYVSLHAAMKCRGLTVTVSLLPPSLPVAAADYFPPVAERYEPRVGESFSYVPPFLLIATPPPRTAQA
jgi:hypothetical protein